MQQFGVCMNHRISRTYFSKGHIFYKKHAYKKPTCRILKNLETFATVLHFMSISELRNFRSFVVILAINRETF